MLDPSGVGITEGVVCIPERPFTIVVAVIRGSSCGDRRCAWAAGVGDRIGCGTKALPGAGNVRGEAAVA